MCLDALDHQQIALACPANDAEQATHLDNFFELLVDEPLKKTLRHVVALLHGGGRVPTR